MLVALGFFEIDGRQIGLTPAGREFAETGDVEVVRDALRRRIVGITQLLGELEQGPRTMEQLQQVLSEFGLAWETNAQLGRRLHWLESVELVGVTKRANHLVNAGPPLLQSQPTRPSALKPKPLTEPVPSRAKSRTCKE